MNIEPHEKIARMWPYPTGKTSIAVLIGTMALAGIDFQAKATIREIQGGPGGQAFALRCNPGTYMTGIHARVGEWIDGISPICAPIDDRGRLGKGARAGYAGGPGGSEQETRCALGEGVTDLVMTFTRGNDLPQQYVDSILMLCGHDHKSRDNSIQSNNGIDYWKSIYLSIHNETPGYYIYGSYYASLSCPANEYAVGLHGRAGNYLDALGLICDSPEIPARPLPSGKDIHVLGRRDTCLSGYVWREARTDDHVCVTPQSRQRAAQENRLAASHRNPAGAYGPETCASGFVWREAFEGDMVCVPPSVRGLVREENRLARSRRKSP